MYHANRNHESCDGYPNIRKIDFKGKNITTNEEECFII